MTSLGPIESAVNARLERLAAEDVVGRIWQKDHTVWKPDPTEIADRLGWLTVAGAMRERVDELEAFAEQAASDGFIRALLLGMGGSSLAPEVMRSTLGVAEGAIDLQVLDSTHPATIARIEKSLDLDRTLFLVASKSGTTIETRSHMDYFFDEVGKGDRFVAITDPGTPLEEIARDRGFRATFLNPDDIGGRYSALSLFGLVPASFMGADLGAFLHAGEEMADACRKREVERNPGAWLGAALGEGALAARDKLTLVLPEDVSSLGSWIEQLVAESTGKEGRGILPVAGESPGPPEVYQQDRVFVAVSDSPAVGALKEHPVVRLEPETLGGEFFRWEFATAVAGHVLGINPFDQPDVQEAKDATSAILKEGPGEERDRGDLTELLGTLRPGDYVAIQAFLDATPDAVAALQRARLAIRDLHRVATTVGIGPRFLHSTGQLHKGGPDTGVFIQVVDEERDLDVSIPGAPYTFGTLIDAQALGDLRALRSKGRRVARVTLGQLAQAVNP
jgi:glucose-6-phosphate isomerase